MSQFIETIRVEADNSVPLLSYHLARLSQTLGHENHRNIAIELKAKLSELLSESQSQCIRKYRVLYTAQGISETSLNPYLIRPITTLTVAPITFDYNHKYADRIEINTSYHAHLETDDILMVKDGCLTDTSYGNVALLEDGIWHTPNTPLLHGCRRQYLIDNEQIVEKKIRIEDLNSYSYLMVFNAMIPFGRILIPTRHLHY